MAKRMIGLDVLGEVRRAQRILRRVERWLVQCERDVKRKAKKDRERFEARVAANKKRSSEWEESKRIRDEGQSGQQPT